MEITNLVIKLIFLFVPGAIATVIVSNITVHKPWNSFYFSIYSLILGFLSYFALQVVYYLYAWMLFIPSSLFSYRKLEFWAMLLNGDKKLPFTEIFFACLLAIFIGILISAAIQHKWLTKWAQHWNISSKFGDENLWSYFLNSKEIRWVCIRDKSAGFTYQGVIDSYSENEELREVALRDVSVYTYNDSELCYKLPAMYLSFPASNLNLEVLILEENEGKNDKKGN